MDSLKQKSPGFTEKRESKRTSTSIDARFFHGNLFYSGLVLDVSERGVFIHTNRFLPYESMFVIIFRIESELLKVIAKVKRIVKDDTQRQGMGVELLSPSARYLEFIRLAQPGD